MNKALKLYSQDRTGLVDFALESGGECPGQGGKPRGQRRGPGPPGVACGWEQNPSGGRARGSGIFLALSDFRSLFFYDLVVKCVRFVSF